MWFLQKIKIRMKWEFSTDNYALQQPYIYFWIPALHVFGLLAAENQEPPLYMADNRGLCVLRHLELQILRPDGIFHSGQLFCRSWFFALGRCLYKKRLHSLTCYCNCAVLEF